MLLANYDFYDLHALLVFFRQYPQRAENYKEPLQIIIDYLEAPADLHYIECNYVRKQLIPYIHSEDCGLEWAKTENTYIANIRVIKQPSRYKILAAVFEEVLSSLDDEQKLNQLCDAAHNIPLLLADEKHPKRTIRKMIKPYNNQYNPNFLTVELKNLHRK